GIALLVYMYDKFCLSSLNVYFAEALGFFFVSLLCQLFSYKITAISQDYYLLFLEEYDSEREEKLKAFGRCNRAHRVNVFLEYFSLFSFSFACIAFFIMLLG
ncbi:MAG: hypothetical protein LBJ71_04050, partial [Holosporaceae bacterium]|nr:hypothetical protein [Holosporaceae bacterium]